MNRNPLPRRAAVRRLLGGSALIAFPTSSEAAEPAPPRPLLVEGYSSQVSYEPGEELTLHLSATVSQCEIEIVRVGQRNETIWAGVATGLAAQEIPVNASSHGCGWSAPFKMKIPSDWRSGYYHVELKAHEGEAKAASNCFFVLRSAKGSPRSKILLQLSTNTYNAYNNWGGFSLYAYNGRGENQGHRVSFLRPPSTQFSTWEQAFVVWAESNGIELDYAANSDLEFHPEVLEDRKLVLSVGHDEYWSGAMRDSLEKFIASGGNVAFFSGNTCCWQVRSEDGGAALTCYKQNYHVDPVYKARKNRATLSSLWSHKLVGRPETQLTGVGFLWGGYHLSHGQLMDGSGAFNVHHPDHWIFAGTGLERGAAFGGKDTIVGYECDGCEVEWREGLPYPTLRDGTPQSFQILASAPAQWHPDDCEWYDEWENGRKGHAILGVYTHGGTVFTCGSTDWSHGLRGGDPAVVRITKNILERLG